MKLLRSMFPFNVWKGVSVVMREMLKRLRFTRKKPNVMVIFAKAFVQRVWFVQMHLLLTPECHCRSPGFLLL